MGALGQRACPKINSFPRGPCLSIETYCVCTASSSAASPRFAAQKRTVFAQHLLQPPGRALPHRSVLCSHSIFSTNHSALPQHKKTYWFAQHLLQPPARALPHRSVLCLHSIFFSRLPARCRTEAYCVCTASSQPTTARLAANVTRTRPPSPTEPRNACTPVAWSTGRTRPG